MILADTSVWVKHFRHGSPELGALLEEGRVAIHSFIIGELACGNLARRAETIQLLGNLPEVPAASGDEVLAMVEGRRLFGRGLGWVDAHLLAAALAGGHRVWTLDLQLGDAANSVGAGYVAV